MVVVLLLFLLILNGNCQEIFEVERNENLVSCVTNIVYQYYEEVVTYVDINSGENEILKAINSMANFLVISRTTNESIPVPNMGYLVFANNATDFAANFHNLNNEAYWSPSMRFLIIIKSLEENNLKEIFNALIALDVINVIVVNGTEDAEVYTYNPFENYACGNYYERVISFGKCLDTTAHDLYPDKLVTGFRRCTLRVLAPHMPPYSMNPDRSNRGVYYAGLEQFAFDIVSNFEEFKVNYTYVDFAEKVSSIDNNFKATGSLELIQNNVTDALLGFTMLTSERAAAFDYLYKHIAFSDEFTAVVKRAGIVPIWKIMYLEFDTTVWILLAVAFNCVLIIFLIVFRVDDKTVIVLKMWDNLLLHGYNYRCRWTFKIVLIAWIWFTYLVNSFYQSSLMSFTTHPIESYQVSTAEDLVNFRYKSCTSFGIVEFLRASGKLNLLDNDVIRCSTMVKGMEVVSETEGLYTIVPLSIYDYNKFLFYNKRGKPKTFNFHKPLSKVIYATYLYKGCPMHDRWDRITLRIREVGLMDHYSRYINFQNEFKFKIVADKSFEARMIIPWNILGVGSVVAAFIFILEILSKHDSVKSANMV